MAILAFSSQPSSSTLFTLSRQIHTSSIRYSRISARFSSRQWLNFRFATTNRLDSFYSRCSITNTDVFNGVATEEVVHEDLSAAASNCSVPIVHLNSDLIETESLNLLAEGTYVDTLLTTLPVLTEEEQNVIAATPAHPAGLYALYATCLVGSMVEQLWTFAWPAAIAMLHPSLLPVAVMGFFTKISIIFGGPLLGKLMDHSPRVPTFSCLAAVQTAAHLLSVGMIIHAHTARSTLASSVLLRPWFVVLVLAGAVERLFGLALGVAMERDWVVLLAGTNRPVALAQANAILSRIDLLCEIAGASLFGILLSKYEPVTCLKLAAGLMISSLPVVVCLTWLTNKLSAGVLDRAKLQQSCCRSSSEGSLPNVENLVQMSVGAIKQGWIEYMQQPVLPASLAYVLLCFNVVLAPGGLMTAFFNTAWYQSIYYWGLQWIICFHGRCSNICVCKHGEATWHFKGWSSWTVIQHLLVNLLYSLAGRHLELYEVENNDVDNKQQVVSLIKYVQSKRGSMMWENEDPTVVRTELPSAALLSALVQSMVDAIFFQGDLRETWGAEALKWAMECTSRHLACRSHQIYRALRPHVTSDASVSLLRCIHRCLGNPVPSVLGFIMEILLTLQVMVENMEPEKVILYPQLFWGCVALMHTDFVHVYCQVLELFSRVIDRLSFHDRTTENVLLSSMPRDELESRDSDISNSDFQRMESRNVREPLSSRGKVPSFEGVQPLVLKGLMSTVSHGVSIEVLSRITVHSCDSIFGDSETRLLMHITGLLPWLCLQLSQEAIVGPASLLQQQYQKACSVATNIAIWCRARSMDELATVFMAYSAGEIKSIDNLLACVSPLLCNEWFPRHSALAFGHLLRLLEKGPVEYQRVILLMLKALLQHTPMDAAQSPHMYAIVSRLVESTLCCEALSVLEALLQSCSSFPGSHPHDPRLTENGLGGAADEKMLAPQTSFKARSGPLQYAMGVGFGAGSTPTAQGTATESGISPRDLALQNTRLILGRVLDSSSLGRRMDYRRLVPFVTSIGNP